MFKQAAFIILQQYGQVFCISPFIMNNYPIFRFKKKDKIQAFLLCWFEQNNDGKIK